MAKPELRDHRKFLKLKRLLNEPGPHVLGYLEYLWTRGYQTGSPVVGDSNDVEAAAEYPGEPGKFAKAAHDSGFLDFTDGTFTIHDLYEHAPKYAKQRMVRRGTDVKEKPKRKPRKDKEVTDGTNGPRHGPRGPRQGPDGTWQDSEGFTTKQNEAHILDPKPKPRTQTQSENKPLPLARPRNELFDAVAEVTGLDPKGNGAIIGTSVKSLNDFDPPITPAEVREFGSRFWEICTWAAKENRQRPTPTELAKWINGIRAKPPPKQINTANAAKITHGTQVNNEYATMLQQVAEMNRLDAEKSNG